MSVRALDVSYWLSDYLRYGAEPEARQGEWVQANAVLQAYRCCFQSAWGRSDKDILQDIMVVVDTEYHRHRHPRLERFAQHRNADGTLLLRATDKDEMFTSHWLLKYLRYGVKDDACEYGWVKMDTVLRAYRHQFRDAQGRTDAEIWDAIMVVVNQEYHKNQYYQGRLLPPLPCFDKLSNSYGLHYLRATHRREATSLTRRSPPLPTEKTSGRAFREEIDKELVTSNCFICLQPAISEVDTPIRTACCLQLVHYRCLGPCIKPATPGCPMCKKEIFHCPPMDAEGGELADEANDFISELGSDYSMTSSSFDDMEEMQQCLGCHRVAAGRHGTGQYDGNYYCDDCWRNWRTALPRRR